MPKVVLTYFNLRAIGDAPRMLLAYGGQEFEDRRFQNEQDPEWIKFRPNTPFGLLPLLEIDGKQYSESVAISRYLGHKYGLSGADIEEDFEIDQVVELLNDLYERSAAVHYEKDAAIKARKYENYSKNVYPPMLEKLNEIITENNGHLALGKLTWADFLFTSFHGYRKMMLRMPDLDEKYPIFKKVQENVLNLPRVKEFIAKAPKSDI